MPGPPGIRTWHRASATGRGRFLTEPCPGWRDGGGEGWSEKNLPDASLEFMHNLASIVRGRIRHTSGVVPPLWPAKVSTAAADRKLDPDLASEAVVQRAAQAPAPLSRPNPSARRFPSGSTTLSSTRITECCLGNPAAYSARADYSDLVFQFNIGSPSRSAFVPGSLSRGAGILLVRSSADDPGPSADCAFFDGGSIPGYDRQCAGGDATAARLGAKGDQTARAVRLSRWRRFFDPRLIRV